jgi:general stress protein 26
MRGNKRTCFVVAAWCLSAVSMAGAGGRAPEPAAGQAPKGAPPDRARIIAVATGIMQRARFCAFITVGLDGHPQSRIVDAFEPGPDMTIWIATTPVTRKVAEIRRDPRVTLSYFDTGSMSYVTLLGRAALVTDAAERSKHWKEDWAKLYKDKYRGDDYLLIKVAPVRLEVSAESQGVMNDPKTWRPVIVEFK